MAQFFRGGPPRNTLVLGTFGSGTTSVVSDAVERGRDQGVVVELSSRAILASNLDEIADLVRAQLGADGRDVGPAARVVVVVENIDAMLENLPDSHMHDFFALFRDPSRLGVSAVLLVGSARPAVRLQQQEGIECLRLAPLPVEDAIRLIGRIAARDPWIGDAFDERRLEIEGALRQINPIIRGNARFCSLMATHLSEGDMSRIVGRARASWRAHMDTYVRERLGSLAPAERRIVARLAVSGRPQTVTQIAERIGTSNQSAATALGRLSSAGWVSVIAPVEGADRRRSWYDLVDPCVRLFFQDDDALDFTEVIAEGSRLRQGTNESQPLGLLRRDVDAHENSARIRSVFGDWVSGRDLYRQLVVERALEVGLDDERTSRALREHIRLSAELGDREAAAIAFDAAIRASDRMLGSDSAEGVALRLDAAWNLLELDRPGEAIRVFEEALAALGDSDENDRNTARLDALQNRARALGQLGDVDAAVHAFEDVLEQRRRLLPNDHESIRGCLNGLAWWTGVGGKAHEAVRIYEELATTPEATALERLRYRESEAYWIAQDPSAGPGIASARLLNLASEFGEADGRDAQRSDARRRILREALKWHLVASPSGFEDAPVRDVDPKDLAEVVLSHVREHRDDPAALARLPSATTELQLLGIVLRAAFSPSSHDVYWRATAISSLASRFRGELAGLFGDLEAALVGDAAAESGLPVEWRRIVSEIQSGPS
ncbi:tetratricopeptide repeat protein [Agromyces sp. Leaf222]|uniref:tetratricopeptide repeat protein n=1 Tax=Agromyces sp. Leaf222 TaxID=1735688 RepID=UPI0012F98E7B|nr:tetratricopeptide repeat protein [Agromyces sp. Leaf222]